MNETEHTSPPDASAGPWEVSLSGQVTDGERTYALTKIERVLLVVAEPVLHVSVRLQHNPDTARERPAMIRCTVDVNGQVVRVQLAANTMGEAADLLADRLRHRIEQLAAHKRAIRRRGPESAPGTWRHGDHSTPRPTHFPRPPAERELVRHKTYLATESTIDEAIFDLESMDFDFYLFAELTSGQDSLVWRGEDGGYLVQAVDAGLTPADDAYAALEVDPRPAPRLGLADATDRLDTGNEPWVFFADVASGRGHVLYRRYDGHYGLITPADEAD